VIESIAGNDTEKLAELKKLDFSSSVPEKGKLRLSISLVNRELRGIRKLHQMISELKASKQDLKKYFADYKEFVRNGKAFQATLEIPEDVTFEDFLLMIIKIAKYVRENYRMNQPNNAHDVVIQFIHSQYTLKFESGLKSAIQQFMCMDKIDMEVLHVGAEKYNHWGKMVAPKSCSATETEISDHCGALLSFPIPKRFRIAVGYCVVKYVCDELRVLLNTKNKSVSVYVTF
jgi:hypothetical protein